MIARWERPDGALAALAGALGVLVSGALPRERCAAWAEGVLAAKGDWTAAFEGEQFSLGNAFYTHLEESRGAAYFAGAAASDAAVERHAPGLQAAMRELVARATGGQAVPRRGWCGAGVHVFLPRSPVARHGGAVHFDTEGLSARHIAARRPALSVVAVLKAPSRGGGLTLWDVRYDGRDHPTDEELRAPRAVVPYEPGAAAIFDSYRLHQICPFGGDAPRVTATLHAAEVDAGLWETWF